MTGRITTMPTRVHDRWVGLCLFCTFYAFVQNFRFRMLRNTNTINKILLDGIFRELIARVAGTCQGFIAPRRHIYNAIVFVWSQVISVDAVAVPTRVPSLETTTSSYGRSWVAYTVDRVVLRTAHKQLQLAESTWSQFLFNSHF